MPKWAYFCLFSTAGLSQKECVSSIDVVRNNLFCADTQSIWPQESILLEALSVCMCMLCQFWFSKSIRGGCLNQHTCERVFASQICVMYFIMDFLPGPAFLFSSLPVWFCDSIFVLFPGYLRRPSDLLKLHHRVFHDQLSWQVHWRSVFGKSF